MSGRTVPLSKPVTLTFDGEEIPAREGEPVILALVAAGKLAIARSPKFHRPRGPACLRAACDGCLARVDETPNVMTCRTPARAGMSVTSQNVLGSRRMDLLRMTDWFFPEGMNHHELLAGVPGLSSIMQAFARRVAGLGKLPAEPGEVKPSARRAADAVVVGNGPSGMAVAAGLAEKGRRVEVIDDSLFPGGGARALADEDAAAFEAISKGFQQQVDGGAIRLRTSTTAVAIFGGDLLVVDESGAEIVNAQTFILAPGAHDGVLAFEGNDVPGVMSARAGGWFLRSGVKLGDRVVVIVPEGGGPFGESFARGASGSSLVTVVHGEPVRVTGDSCVKSVTVREGTGERTLDADAVLVDAPRSPAYELCAQAGAEVSREPRGFVVKTDKGRIGSGIWAAGEACGTPFEANAIAAEALVLCAAIAAS